MIDVYMTDRKEGYVLRELQRGLTSMDSWCERWNMQINEDKTQAICFSHRRSQVEAYLILKGRCIPFGNNVKYLGVIFDKNYMGITYRNDHHQGLRIFVSIYHLLKIERLIVNTKLNLYKALIRSIMTYSCPAWEFAADR
jgi:hypothetical protein